MQKPKAVLFDLDGTLLPMDQDEFTGYYFGRLCAKAAPRGYEAEKLVATIWKGTAAMMKNDGSVTNEEAFWNHFASVHGEEKLADKPVFDEFYANEFEDAKASCGFNPAAVEAVRELKAMGLRVTLATNPIFPETAQLKRIRWAGFEPEDFEFHASYETARHA